MEEGVKSGRFREDLYYRLNVVNITIPPLRERREEIPIFVEYFLDKFSKKYQKKVISLSDKMINALSQHRWSGNVRELENVIERAIVTCHNGTLDEQDFSWLQRPAGSPQEWEVPDIPLGELERRAIIAALERKHGNVKEASAALGIDRSTLYDKLKHYEISH